MHLRRIFNKRESAEVLAESKTIHLDIPSIAFTGGAAAAAFINNSPDYSNEDRIPHQRFQDTQMCLGL
jgi:hypothetical protein